ncbi:hypothetical protein GOP47_0013401 [Adiantum capillus-veneris]|uniref:ABC-2 type transporter transmembrane domain-containing protein n=1 Tax=Adiantum capillus-veneris TaxID=13818 RepID=A0A9D4UNN7_ADICA|nr:hypothetical protein GOP47_0013401 [Adiantum capillus-veneris]
MGFTCPERKSTADFLQEVISKKDQHQYWADQSQPYRYITVEEFARAFESYRVGQQLRQELAIPYDASKSHPAALSTHKYDLPIYALFKACFSREVLIWKRNSFLYIFKTCQLAFISTIAMTVFFRTKLSANSVEGGFYTWVRSFMDCLLSCSLEWLRWLWSLIGFLSFTKKDTSFFILHGHFQVSVPAVMIRMPLSALESLIWVCFTYFVIGFAPEAHRFFQQILLLFCTSQMALGMFRLLGAVGRSLVIASSFGTFALMVLFLMGGFLVAREQIPALWIWAYWLSPMTYALNAIFTNEFLADRWQKPYSGTIDAHTIGTAVLKSNKWGSLQSKGIDIPNVRHKPVSSKHINVLETGTEAQKGMVLPFQPLSIAFNSINYYVDMPAEMKQQGMEADRLQLLQDVSGAFRPRVLTALVGLSWWQTLLLFSWTSLRLGLDARAAAIVMRTVHNTVDTGRTVVCTIHQPSIDIFESFDELLLLKNGGQVIYAGPLGHRSCKLVEYFQEIPGMEPIKDGYNPATWMLNISSPSAEARLQVDFAQIYKDSPLYQRTQALIKELSTPLLGSKDLYFPTQYPQSFREQCMACLWKQHSLLENWSKNGDHHRLVQHCWRDLRVSLFLAFHNVTTVQSVVAIERTVFYRERGARMYSALSYAFAQATIEIPYIFTQSIIYVGMIYAMINYKWTASKFLSFFYFMFLTLVFFTYFGMMMVALTPNVYLATMIAVGFLSLWNLFSGFMIPQVSIPVWWRWFYWADPLAWSMYGLIGSQLANVQEKVSDPDHGAVLTVKQYMERVFGYKQDFLGVVAGVHIGLALLFVFVFAFSIKKFNFQRR